MKSISFTLILSLLIVGCLGDKIYLLSIKNNSGQTISFYVGSFGSVYPDTSLVLSKIPMQTIPPAEERHWDISYPFEQFFQHLPKDTLSVFLFDTDTLNKYDWNTIRSQYKVLKRYDLSLSDLQAKNFVVAYP
jgi:hypothetical protein